MLIVHIKLRPSSWVLMIGHGVHPLTFSRHAHRWTWLHLSRCGLHVLRRRLKMLRLRLLWWRSTQCWVDHLLMWTLRMEREKGISFWWEELIWLVVLP